MEVDTVCNGIAHLWFGTVVRTAEGSPSNKNLVPPNRSQKTGCNHSQVEHIVSLLCRLAGRGHEDGKS